MASVFGSAGAGGAGVGSAGSAAGGAAGTAGAGGTVGSGLSTSGLVKELALNSASRPPQQPVPFGGLPQQAPQQPGQDVPVYGLADVIPQRQPQPVDSTNLILAKLAQLYGIGGR